MLYLEQTLSSLYLFQLPTTIINNSRTSFAAHFTFELFRFFAFLDYFDVSQFKFATKGKSLISLSKI